MSFSTFPELIPDQLSTGDILLKGLDPLHALKQVFIYRSRNPPDTLTKNRKYYDIIDNNGTKIFNAVETNHTFSRICCSDLRKFELSILQNFDNIEIMRYARPCRGDCWCCFGCSQSLEVYSHLESTVIGTISQQWSICRPHFVIKLPNGEALLRAFGPCCTLRCCVRELNFDVTTFNRLGDVALISSQWTGLLRDELGEVNFYGIEFKQDVDTNMKALILGVCFLVNALYYQI